MARRRQVLSSIGAALLGIGGLAGFGRPTNPYYAGPVSDHFDGTRFFVPGHPFTNTFGDFLKWRLQGDKVGWPRSFASPFVDRPPRRLSLSDLRVTMIGHASLLVQAGGKNILIDPVFSDRASPVGFAGPMRVNPPGIAFADLPPIDIVLVSHNHYDHLDQPTLARLQAAHRPRFLTPLGNDGLIADGDATVHVTAHDWGEVIDLGDGVRIHVEPAYHWSARGMFDRLMALWCAFVIESPAGKLYHVADSGFGDGAIFAAMRAKHGGFRIATLPIGAYEPRWFMAKQHFNPEEALRVKQLCGAEAALGHHWGTFQLTDEGIEQPIEALGSALATAGLPSEGFAPLRPGQVWLG